MSDSRLIDLSRYFAVLGLLKILLVSGFAFARGFPSFIHPLPAVVYVVVLAAVICMPFLVGWGMRRRLRLAWYLGALYLTLLALIGLGLSLQIGLGAVIFVVAGFGLVLLFKDDLAILKLLKQDA